MRFCRHIVWPLLAVLALFSCGRQSRVIPRSKMARIYADMFMADRWFDAYADECGVNPDTLLVYEPIFRSYGYTSDDYRASVRHYMEDSDRFARILKHSAAFLESRSKELGKEKKILDSRAEAWENIRRFAPKRIFYMSGIDNKEVFTLCDSIRIMVDSTGTSDYRFDVQKGRDTVFSGPEVIIVQKECSDSLK